MQKTDEVKTSALFRQVTAERIDGHGSLARTKDATLILDTDVAGRSDAFNPAELFLASIAAFMIKGIDRVTPLLKFDLRAVDSRCVLCGGLAAVDPPR